MKRLFANQEYYYINDVKNIITELLNSRNGVYTDSMLDSMNKLVFNPYFTCTKSYSRLTNRYTFTANITAGRSKAMIKEASAMLNSDIVYSKLTPVISQMFADLTPLFEQYMEEKEFPSDRIKDAIKADFYSLAANPFAARHLLNVVIFNTPLNKMVINIHFS